MLINVSRIKTAMACWRKALYAHGGHLQEEGGIKSVALTIGSAFHEGMALGRAQNDWEAAVEACKTRFAQDAPNLFLEIEDDERERHELIATTLVKLAGADWQERSLSVIQPECEFRIPIPNTEHNDITLHWVDKQGEEHWGYPDLANLQEGIATPHAEGSAPFCPCWRSHILVGKIDTVVSAEESVWLEEHKTTSRFSDLFWAQWALDIQPLTYVWAAEQFLGLEVEGFIINGARKPAPSTLLKNVGKYCEYQSRQYPVSRKQKRDNIANVVSILNEWEGRMVSGIWPLSNTISTCTTWNRRCTFFDVCLGERSVTQYERREDDYVLKAYKEDVQLIQEKL